MCSTDTFYHVNALMQAKHMYLQVVAVPLEPPRSDSHWSTHWHQPTVRPLQAWFRLNDAVASWQQSHQVALTPQADVEVGKAVERVEVAKGVIQAAPNGTCKIKLQFCTNAPTFYTLSEACSLLEPMHRSKLCTVPTLLVDTCLVASCTHLGQRCRDLAASTVYPASCGLAHCCQTCARLYHCC